MKKKLKVKITLEYWENDRGSYDGFVTLNGQPFRFANLTEEGAIKMLRNNTEWLCDELIKKIEEKKQNE